MIEARLTVTDPAGLHARPAALFVRVAAGYESNITVTNVSRAPEKLADAKSILSVMTLGVEHGHDILVRAEGPDEQQAIRGLRTLIEGDPREG